MVSPQYTRRVLYVEDHADTVELVTLMLEASGFQVVSRATMAEGLNSASQQKFDLYLLDLWLPDGSGIELCKKLREFDTQTPIAFYSAAAYAGDREAAMESGAQAYLIKPSDSLSLADKLHELLRRDGHRQNLS